MYEKLSRKELEKIVSNSISFRDMARGIGYSPDGGSTIRLMHKIIEDYNLDNSHFLGKGHGKTLGSYNTKTEDYLNNNVKVNSHKLRLRLIEEEIFQESCSSCGLELWLGQKIPLELHHKDGNNDNNNLENLELLCPNCHYFTDTYKSKNVGNN